MQQPGQPQRSGVDIVVQGRIVWGGVKQQTKNVYGTRTPAIDPKTGKEIIEWAFGLAVPKPSAQSNQHETANFQALWNAVCAEGGKLGFQQPGQPGFHWKFDDGDGRKPDGSAYPAHSQGCLVVACKTRIPLKLMAWENGKCVQVTEDQIKCGDYVQVAINIEGHGNPNAGLYINPSFVARFAYGEAIVNAPDATAIFGTTAPPIPFGGSATPMGGGYMQAPGFGGAPAVPAMAAPMGGYQQPQQAAAPIQPHHAVLPGQFNPGAQAQGGQGYPPNGSGNGAYPVPGGSLNGQQGMPAMQPQGQPVMGNAVNTGMGGYGQQTPGNQTQGMNQVGPGPTAPTNAYPSNPMGPWQPPQ